MKEAAVYIEKRKITNIKIANNFWTRFMGLMGKSPKQIENMGGLLIKPCSQFHMFFMKTPIDVIYLNKNNEIIKIDSEVPTGICCKKVKGSKSVLELPSGYATKLGFNSKDRLEVV